MYARRFMIHGYFNFDLKEDISSSLMDRPVRSRKWNGVESRNRFDDLPDETLLHILSFLGMKSVVKASLVSKRWKDLWMSVPNLRFVRRCDDRRAMFLNFVDRVLRFRNSCKINKFLLYFSPHADFFQVSTWIDYAVSHCVQDLNLRLGFLIYDLGHDWVLPDSLFTCKSLTKMELQMFGPLNLPPVIHFSSLKFLKLSRVRFQNDQLTNQLFSNCPLLEELELFECSWSDLESLHISAPMLVSLEIYEDCNPDGKLVIHGANLKSFRYLGPLESEVCFLNSSSLLVANIDVNDIEGEELEEVADRAHKLFKGLYNVNYLIISHETLQILKYKEDSFSQMPVFQNLTRLRLTQKNVELRSPVDILCGALLNLLRKSPSLEHLEALEGMILGPPNGKEDMGLLPFPECFLTSLKIVTLANFCGAIDEYAGIKVLLMFAKVLEKLHFKFIGDKKAKRELLRQLGEMFPKETLELVSFS